MKLSLVINQLTCGGAERVLIQMANAFVGRGYDVSVITLAGPHSPFMFLDNHIHLIHLDEQGVSLSLAEGLSANFRRIRSLRKAFSSQRPDVIISFMDTTNVLCILASLNLNTPVIAAEHIDPNVVDIGRIWKLLRLTCYPLASAVTVLTKNVLPYFPRFLGTKVQVLPNPIAPPPACASPPKSPSHKILIGMGRLSHQKGFDMLIQAFQRLAPDFPHWKLVIMGEGANRGELEEMVFRFGLENAVSLPGVITDPFPFLKAADIFVLSSRFEGFPMALCEAMACGLPAVAFDCPSGPADIIRQEVDGLLVPTGDVSALAAALARLMTDESLRRAYAERAPDILTRFGLEKVLDMWESLLLRVSKGKQAP